MAIELVVAPEAELDIAEAFVWYESRRTGLGEEFLSSLDAWSGRHPPSVGYVSRHLRELSARLTRRFPYAVFYELADGTVAIYAVLHTSRDPNKWRQRLP